MWMMFQRRFYRGRTRKQTEQPVIIDDVVPHKPSFESDMVSFHSDLQVTETEFGKDLTPTNVEEMSIPELSRHACNLVPYVSRSETLQNLVKLGVNLDVVQTVDGVAELLLKSQFERDIAPLIHLLNLAGVPADAMGLMLTRNPLLFTQSIEDLSSRIGYFLSL
ncbi:transcription termination factor 3, mitochondrial [Elysia marginata]|uniref:Transcription termination factor 3, mitochondrial n=1 Tax=Elysia marginata TaxID=1093978 RepID=A0AAV4HSY0_9GAST|nr:transcription termination factor 3, mitochondrial [Elysia marginata]